MATFTALALGSTILTGLAFGGAVADFPLLYSEMPDTPTLRFSPEFSAVTTDLDGRVVSASDLSGTADATVPSGQSGPRVLTDARGVKFWRFDGDQLLDVAGGFSSNTRAISVIAVMRDPGVNNTNCIFSQGSIAQGTGVNTGNPALHHRVVSGEMRSIGMGSRRSAQAVDPAPLSPGSQLHVAAATSFGPDIYSTSVTFQMNGVQSEAVGSTNNVTVVGGQIGQYALNGSGGVFDLYELVVFSGDNVLSPDRLGVNVSHLMGVHGVVDFQDQLILEGDSISAGSIETLGNTNPATLLSEPGLGVVPGGWRVNSGASSGDKISDLIADRDGGSEYFSSPLSGRNVVAFEVGRNDLSTQAAADVYSQIVSYINSPSVGLLQRGCEVRALCNISSGASGGIYDARITELRALLLDPQFLIDCDAGPGGSFDGLVTVISTHLVRDGTIEPFLSFPPNPAYMQSDATHPNVEGARLRVTGGDAPQYGVAFGLS